MMIIMTLMKTYMRIMTIMMTMTPTLLIITIMDLEDSEAETIETGSIKLTKFPLAKSKGVPLAVPPKTPPNAPS